MNSKAYTAPLRRIIARISSDKDVALEGNPTRPKRVRLPIIINGAGPAGLVLAIGLKNAAIPFEICEKERHDLDSRPRRNHGSLLYKETLVALKNWLKIPSYRTLLNDIALTRPAACKDVLDEDHPIDTESLMGFLRKRVSVNYGYRLEREGISSLESTVTSKFIAGQAVKTFQGSLLVGADGIYSAVRDNWCIFTWPAITYVSSIKIPRAQYESYFRKFATRDNMPISRVYGNAQLMLTINQVAPKHAHMSLWYSRLSSSSKDYQAFFGTTPDQRFLPQVDYKYDAFIAGEIEPLRPLAEPFAAAFDLCKDIGISQKWYLDCVWHGGSGLPTAVSSGKSNMAAVVIGDAAHAIPEILSPADINHAMFDAIDLCKSIVGRYDNDELFSRIASDYYETKETEWRLLRYRWDSGG